MAPAVRIVFECAVCVQMSMYSVLEDMHVCMALPTCLRSFMGLMSMYRRAAATPEHQVLQWECAQCRR